MQLVDDNFKDNKIVVHFIDGGTFFEGYYTFMNRYLPEYNHYYITTSEINKSNTFFIEDYKNLFNKERYKDIKELLCKSYKIIISGNFHLYLDLFIMFSNRKLLKKTFVQLWGGDFYYLNNGGSIKDRIAHWVMKRFYSKCKALVFLIPEDYSEFSKITNVHNDYYVAQMPLKEDKVYVNEDGSDDEINVLVGNSATESNNHIFVFDLLSKYREKIQVFCPLSYGDESYRDIVIKYGQKAFGDRFHAITEFMDSKEYNSFLNRMSIGIFANDRQQALGNILTLLRLNKKIFLKQDSVMWNNFIDSKKVQVYSVQSIESMGINEFVDYPEIIAKENAEKIDDFLY